MQRMLLSLNLSNDFKEKIRKVLYIILYACSVEIFSTSSLFTVQPTLSLPAGFVCQVIQQCSFSAVVTGTAFCASCSYLSLHCPVSCLTSPALPFNCWNSLYPHTLLRRVAPGRAWGLIRRMLPLVTLHVFSCSPSCLLYLIFLHFAVQDHFLPCLPTANTQRTV